MEQSQSIAALVAALAKAQLEVRNPQLDRAHPHFKGFRYASLGSHIDAIREPFAKHGLIVTQGVNSEGDRVSVSTQIAHTSGEWIRATVGITLAERAKAQDLGAAVTYLRRYAIASIAMLTGDDDTDADEDRAAKEPPRAPAIRPQSPAPAPAQKQKADLSVFDSKKPKTNDRPWPESGSDVVLVEKFIPRGEFSIAVLCKHATMGSAWVSIRQAIADPIKVGKTCEITWRWNDSGERGFYEATDVKAAPTLSAVKREMEIPFP